MELKARLKPGDVFNRYKVEKLLGLGYSGEVHEVVHQFTGQRFALKYMHEKDRENTHKASRSMAEARTLFRLEHANIVRVHDAGVEDDGTVWMLLELLEGQTLEDLLGRRGRLSPMLALYYALEICWGVDAAHEIQVIHRDLKPANVFITNGNLVKVLDFATAKFLTYELRTTKPPDRAGTLAYMSPEYLRGDVADARIDVYAIGLMLWEMLGGRNPFAHHFGNQYQLITAQMEEMPALLADVAGLPPYVDEVIQRAVAKDMDDRYPSVGELARALLRLMERLQQDASEGRIVLDTRPGEPPIPIAPHARRDYHSPERTPRLATGPVPPPERVTLARPIVDAPVSGPTGTAPLTPEIVAAAQKWTPRTEPTVRRTPIEEAKPPPPAPPPQPPPSAPASHGRTPEPVAADTGALTKRSPSRRSRAQLAVSAPVLAALVVLLSIGASAAVVWRSVGSLQRGSAGPASSSSAPSPSVTLPEPPPVVVARDPSPSPSVDPSPPPSSSTLAPASPAPSASLSASRPAAKVPPRTAPGQRPLFELPAQPRKEGGSIF